MDKRTAKERYRQQLQTERGLPIFFQPWWLDAVVGKDHWGVALVESNGEPVACLPYAFRRRYGFWLSEQPPLTPALGPWISPLVGHAAKRLSRQKELMSALIAQLPKFDYLAHNWHWRQTNWLPFYWRGYQQTTRYTYLLESIEDLDLIWKELHQNTRWQIRKAQRQKLVLTQDARLADFLALYQKTFQRQGLKVPVPFSVIRRVDRAGADRGQRKIFIIQDEQGRQHAGVYLIWDQETAYYLMGGSDPELRSSGAMSLALWEAIQFSSGRARRFDFEGSMLESVEKYFRSFGALQTPYFRVSKTESALLRVVSAVKALRR